MIECRPHRHAGRRFTRAAAALTTAALALPTLANPAITYEHGIEFVTIGALGNAPVPAAGAINPIVAGRGSVSYAYRIGRTEITTAQYLEFYNTFWARPDTPGWLQPPNRPFAWGAVRDLSYTGPGSRWMLDPHLPDAANVPVTRLTWYDAATMCNWLHNNKSPDPAALLTGAYDASTWGMNPDGTYTDAPTRMPGARFFIPTYDEWLKAVHYDPDRHGPGAGGYWLYPNSSDQPMIPGPPGVGQTSGGYVDPDVLWLEAYIPLRSYPDQQSPWGLLDASGGTSEWMEDYHVPGDPRDRLYDGSPAGAAYLAMLDSLENPAAASPYGHAFTGFRIAAAIPAPASAFVLAALAATAHRRRGR